MSLGVDLTCEDTEAFGTRCCWPLQHNLHGPPEPTCPRPEVHHAYKNRAAVALGLHP